jgi:hypothetical protein
MTKAVTTKPQMKHDKKKQMNLIKGKNHLKKENEGGEKTESSDKEFVFVKRMLFRKPTAATIILKKINWLAATMILKKIYRLTETRMSTLKKI